MKDSRSIIKKLEVTEKGTLLGEANKYLFKVAPDSNKVEIKRAVEALFDVTVTQVNTMRYTGKRKRRQTLRYGKCADWKRAVVTLAEGNRIDMT